MVIIGIEYFHTCKINMAAGEVKKVRLRLLVLIYRILALFLSSIMYSIICLLFYRCLELIYIKITVTNNRYY